MNIKAMQQFESCDYNEYLIAGDAMLNNIPQAVAAGTNLITQIGTGFDKKDTSAFLAYDKIKEATNAGNNNFEKYGEAFQLFSAQLLKISAGQKDIVVSPTGA